jgi:transposase-like protein
MGFPRIMSRKNKYCQRSRISEWKFREIIRYFAMDIEASKIAALTGVSRNTVNKILTALRIRMVQWCDQESRRCLENTVISNDVCANNDHEPNNTTSSSGRKGSTLPVLGIMKNNEKIFTRFVPEISKKTLLDIMLGKMRLESIFGGNGLSPYSSFIDLGTKKLYRMNQPVESPSKRPKLNCVENFWGTAKGRLSKFRGMNRNTIYLHLKETEFRFNNRNEDLYELLLQKLRKEPLKFTCSKTDHTNRRL